MGVAAHGLLSSGKGAELIREATGRNCTRQNLEKLCKQGKLPDSCVSTAPVRLVAERLVAEYMERIDPRQAARPRPGISQSVLDKAPDSVPRTSEHPDEDLPPYTESQKRKAYEQANLLELERKQKEALLLPAEQVQKVWANSVAIAKTKLLAVPSRLRQRIPHLSLEEIAIAEDLIRESLEEITNGGGGDDE